MARSAEYAESFLSENDSDEVSLTSVNVHDDIPAQRSYNTAETESKAREAASEQRAGSSSRTTAPHSQLSSPALSAMSIPWSEPNILHVNINPPDYATATADQRTYGSVQQPSTSDIPRTSQQQCMSDASPVDEEAGLLTQKPARKRKPLGRLMRCGCVSICNTILIIAVIVLIILLSQAADGGHDSAGGEITIPPKSPNGDEDGNSDDPTTKPYFPPSECAYQHYSETQSFDFFSLSNFTVGEFMDTVVHLSGGIEGTVYVQPATNPGQQADIRLRVAYATTSPFRIIKSNYVKNHDSFNLELPDLQKGKESFNGRPCLGVFIGLEVRPGVKLQNWAISTGNFDILVLDGLFERSPGKEEETHMRVTEYSTFNAIRGKVDVAYWKGRRMIVETISGGISGSFALRDLLSLKTISGHIDVTVDPEPADSERPMPAEFTAVSTSGTIDAQFPTTGDIPLRDFRTRLETVSSSIRGKYIAGTSTSAHTVSGDINAHLLPFYGDTKAVSIHTDSHSGRTKLNVLPPYQENDWPSLYSEHKSASTSGLVDITYPQQWEGEIDAQSNSGSISIQGKDVDVDDNKSLRPVWKHVTARKGKGPGHMGFRTLSGAVNVRIGDS